MQAIKVLDCSNHEPLIGALAELNEYLQKNRLPGLEFQSNKHGPDHMPVFTCSAKWENFIIQATSNTKKEAEKKIKSYIWISCINGNPAVQLPEGEQEQKQKQAKPLIKQNGPSVAETKPPTGALIVDYEEFREALGKMMLSRGPPNNNPTLFIDHTTIKESIEDEMVHALCEQKYSNVVLLSKEKLSVWPGAVVLVIKEDDDILIDESITRVVYYLLDPNVQNNVMVLTKRECHILTDVGEKTDQKVTVVENIKAIWSKK